VIDGGGTQAQEGAMAIIGSDRGDPGPVDPATAARRWSGAISVVVVLGLVVAAFDLVDLSVPDRREGGSILWSSYHLWWAPILAACAAAALLVPRRVLAHQAARVPALLIGVSILVPAVFAIAIIGPVLAWREATLYGHASSFNIGVAFALPAAIGVVGALAAVLIFGRLTDAPWPRRARDLLAGLGLAVCVASVPFGQFLDSWAEWRSLGGAERRGAVIETAGLTLLIFLTALTVVAPGRFLRSGIGWIVAFFVVPVSIVGGVLLSLGGWSAGAMCLARDIEDLCPLAMPLIVASTVALAAGFSLASRRAMLEEG
jgi:hypothetical protein